MIKYCKVYGKNARNIIEGGKYTRIRPGSSSYLPINKYYYIASAINFSIFNRIDDRSYYIQDFDHECYLRQKFIDGWNDNKMLEHWNENDYFISNGPNSADQELLFTSNSDLEISSIPIGLLEHFETNCTPDLLINYEDGSTIPTSYTINGITKSFYGT